MEDSTLIKNEQFLIPYGDISYNSSLLFPRKEQTESLERLTKSYERIRYVWGYPGTGKTTIIKNFLNKQKEIATVIYIDCRIHSSINKIINEVFSSLATIFPNILVDKEFKFTKNKTFAINKMISWSEKKVYIVLDEIDYHIKQSKETDKGTILHLFIREAANDSNNHFRFIFITNKMGFDQQFHEEIRQFLRGGNIILFGVYKPEEIYQILKLRSEQAIVDGAIDEMGLRVIAKAAYQEFDGNMRDAINLLHLSAKRATSKIGYHDIEEATNQLKREKISEHITTFPEGAKDLFASILFFFKKNPLKTLNPKDQIISGEECKESYNLFCSKNNIPQKHWRSIYNYLNVLERMDVLTPTSEFKNKYKIYQFNLTIKQAEDLLNNTPN